MGAWGHMAVESDEGLDVLGLLEKHAISRDRLSADELVEIALAEGFLGEDPHDDDYFYDVTALALAEVLTGVYRSETTPLNRVAFVYSPGGGTVLLNWVGAVLAADQSDREMLELWDGDPAHRAHLTRVNEALRVLAESFSQQ